MKSFGLLYRAPLIRAFLARQKTETRRVMNPQPQWRDNAWYWRSPRYDNGDGVHYFHTRDTEGVFANWCRANPFGAPGDTMYARETLRRAGAAGWHYDADKDPVALDENDPRVPAMVAWAYHRERDYCPSIHMPRWASRIRATVVEVCPQRIQDITHAGLRAEGMDALHEEIAELAAQIGPPGETSIPTTREIFANGWDGMAGVGSWERNDWAWVLKFADITIRGESHSA